MALKNKSMHAILGVLSISPSTGYDIKKYCDKVLSGFWNENYGHIYPTLKTMQDEGLIETIDNENPRTVKYQITDEGREELHRWLNAITDRQPVRSEFTLKFLFSSGQPTDKVISMLVDYKEQHQADIMKYKEMQDILQKGIEYITEERALYLNAVLRRSVLSNEAVVLWCDETIRELQERDERKGLS